MTQRKTASALAQPTGETRVDLPAEESSAPAPLVEQVRVRAYYLSLERNGGAGDPAADWLQAERELASVHSA